MPRGTLRLDASALPWSTGCARYDIAAEHDGTFFIVRVDCRIGGMPFDTPALLDTGAEWSIIGGEHADLLEAHLREPEQRLVLASRFGRIHGELHRVAIVLPADEGESLHLVAPVLVAPGWPGPVVIGYRGCLEHVRFALDPGGRSGDAWFFFAHAE
jgi:hypothetical protein